MVDKRIRSLILACAVTTCLASCSERSGVQDVPRAEGDSKFEPAWIAVCAERDTLWAEFIVQRVVDGGQDDDSREEVLRRLRHIRDALAAVQISDTHLDVREPLFLSDDQKLAFSKQLARHFDIREIRHAAWNYKDSFVESMIVLLSPPERPRRASPSRGKPG